MAASMGYDMNEPLRSVPLLARLGQNDLSDLAALGRERIYQSRTTIVREGDPGDALFLILEGTVRITILSPDGDETTIALLEQHDCFGDLALLDGRPWSATAIAATTTRTLVVLRDEFLMWLSERPQAAIALLETQPAVAAR
jgi:CRP/FNR family cyclic AMP-dependent transcriptional regulator